MDHGVKDVGAAVCRHGFGGAADHIGLHGEIGEADVYKRQVVGREGAQSGVMGREGAQSGMAGRRDAQSGMAGRRGAQSGVMGCRGARFSAVGARMRNPA